MLIISINIVIQLLDELFNINIIEFILNYIYEVYIQFILFQYKFKLIYSINTYIENELKTNSDDFVEIINYIIEKYKLRINKYKVLGNNKSLLCDDVYKIIKINDLISMYIYNELINKDVYYICLLSNKLTINKLYEFIENENKELNIHKTINIEYSELQYKAEKLYYEGRDSKVMKFKEGKCIEKITRIKSLPRVYIDFESNKTFDNIFFKDKEVLINKLNMFINNKQDYKKKSIYHMLGIVLSGPEGCGKNSCIKAIVNYVKYNTMYVDLSRIISFNELHNFSFYYLYGNESGVIALLDNVDYIIENNDDVINLPNLFNMISGFSSINNKIIIIKTKYPEKFNDSIFAEDMTHIKVNLTSCDEDIAISIINNIFDANIHNIKLNKEITPGELTNKCLSVSTPYELTESISIE